MAKPKRLPLPVRRSMNLTEAAYARLREISGKTGLSNNYVLTVLLENLDDLVEAEALDATFATFISEYGAPPPKEPK